MRKSRDPSRGQKGPMTCEGDLAIGCTSRDTGREVATRTFTTSHLAPLRGGADLARSSAAAPRGRARGAARFAGRALRRRWRDVGERLRRWHEHNVRQAERAPSSTPPLESACTMRATCDRPLDHRSGTASITAGQTVRVTHLSSPRDGTPHLVAPAVASGQLLGARGQQQLEALVAAAAAWPAAVARPAGTCEPRKSRSRRPCSAPYSQALPPKCRRAARSGTTVRGWAMGAKVVLRGLIDTKRSP